MTQLSVFPVLAILTLAAAIVVVIVAAVRWAQTRPEKPIIVPMYERPPGIDLMEAAALVRRDRRGVPSMLVDLAVRRVLRILVEDGDGGARYTLELLSRDGLSALETRLVALLFGATAGVGARHALPVAVGASGESPPLVRLRAAARRSIRSRGLMSPSPTAGVAQLRRAAGGVLIGSIAVFALSMFTGTVTGWTILSVVASGIAVGVVVPRLLRREPLPSADGARLRDHVLGLRMYLQLAERERFRMLQSPEGAERVSVVTSGADDRETALKLFERLLPFAVLWGLDDRWTREMSPYLPEDAGDWYGGSLTDFAIQYAVLSSFMASDSNLDDSGAQDDQGADADGSDPGDADGDAGDGGGGADGSDGSPDASGGDWGDGGGAGFGGGAFDGGYGGDGFSGGADGGWGGGDSGGGDSGGGGDGGGGGGD